MSYDMIHVFNKHLEIDIKFWMELSQLKVPKVHMALNDVTHVKTLELKNFVQPSLDCVGAVFCQQTKSMKVQHEFHFTHTCCFLALWEIVSME